jgi:hypothetical protein
MRLSDITDKIPFANRILFIIILATWLLDFIGFTTTYLMNSNLSAPSVSYFWQTFTASFSVNTMFMLVIVSINMYTFFPKLVNIFIKLGK